MSIKTPTIEEIRIACQQGEESVIALFELVNVQVVELAQTIEMFFSLSKPLLKTAHLSPSLDHLLWGLSSYLLKIKC